MRQGARNIYRRFTNADDLEREQRVEEITSAIGRALNSDNPVGIGGDIEEGGQRATMSLRTPRIVPSTEGGYAASIARQREQEYVGGRV